MKQIGHYPDEALQAADKAATEMARQGVALGQVGDPDKRLEHLLRASDEMRATFLTMEARLVEWVGLFPCLRLDLAKIDLVPKQVGEADSLATLASNLSVSMPENGPSKLSGKRCASGVSRLQHLGAN